MVKSLKIVITCLLYFKKEATEIRTQKVFLNTSNQVYEIGYIE